MTHRPHVHVLFTGGTISMRIDPATGAAVPALSGEEILSRTGGLRRETRLTVEDYARLPGPHVTPAWMWRLKEHVADVLRDPEIQGVVVTHGTDTLEETAYLLDLTLTDDRPVVFTGAMRTISEPGWDGPANLTAAVRVAVHPESRGRGVLVAVGEEIHAAAEVVKAHTQSLAAFRSPHGPVAVVDRGQIVFQRAPSRVVPLPATRLVPEVDVHVVAAGTDDALLRASLDRGARGLVVAGTGCGNVTPGMLPGIRAALDRGVPVVLVSRCAEGRLAPAYGYEGGGQTLREMGVLFAQELSAPKARIKLMAALGATEDAAGLRAIFAA